MADNRRLKQTTQWRTPQELGAERVILIIEIHMPKASTQQLESRSPEHPLEY
jgi:hypothetical protein